MSASSKPPSDKLASVTPRSLRRKTDRELERIVRDNAHDPRMLSAVHYALKGRTGKRADSLKAEIGERLVLNRVAPSSAMDVPIWTTAVPLSTEKPWYLKMRYVVLCAGLVAVALVNGVDSYFVQLSYDSMQSLAALLHQP